MFIFNICNIFVQYELFVIDLSLLIGTELHKPPVRGFTLSHSTRKKPVTVCMDAVSVTGFIKTGASL